MCSWHTVILVLARSVVTLQSFFTEKVKKVLSNVCVIVKNYAVVTGYALKIILVSIGIHTINYAI